jgi:hypothetical protein
MCGSVTAVASSAAWSTPVASEASRQHLDDATRAFIQAALA